jgi:hypothetical protein
MDQTIAVHKQLKEKIFQQHPGIEELQFSTESWPPALEIPPGGLEISDLKVFVKAICEDCLGSVGIGAFLDPFFEQLPPLQGVYLTRFEVVLEDNGSTAAFFVGFQLRESWNILSESGLSGIPALAISNPGFTIGSSGGTDASYLVDVYGTLEIFGVAIEVMVQWPAMIITGTLVRELALQDLLSAAGFEGIVSFGEGDETPLPVIRALMLRMDLTNKDFDFSFGMSGWEILPDKLILSNLILDLTLRSERKAASARAEITLCAIDINLSGTFQGGQLELAGSTGSGQAIPIGELIADLGKKFGAFEAPASVAGLTVENLALKFNTHSKDFSFTIETKFPVGDEVDVQDNQLDMVLAIEVKHQQDGTYTKHFSGKITIDKREFDVIFDSTSASATFIAAYNDPQGHPIKIQDLVRKVSPAIGDCIPPSLEFTIKDALLAYQSSKEQKKYLFGIDIDGGLNLSDLRLPDLPLVGPPFPPEQTLKLSFRLLATQSTFKSDEVASLNSLLLHSKLPDKEIPAGIGLSTVLQIGAESKTLALPMGLDPNKKASPDGIDTGLVSTEGPSKQNIVTSESPSAANITAQDGTQWIVLQKNLGPVHLERVGLAYKDEKLTAALDASLAAGGLTISLNGLSVTSPLTELRPTFDLNGLGIEYRNGQLEISAAFLKQTINQGGKDYTSFGGRALISTANLAISAIGSYTKVDDQASLFIYAVLDYSIGGPPFFFVTGVAAGFGYNRNLLVPPIDKISDFPLIQEATRKGGPKKLPADQKEQQQTLSTQLSSLESYLPPAVGQTFLAVGIKFTSFKLIDSFALLTVKFGGRLEFNLLGLSNLVVPPIIEGQPPTPPIAVAQLALKATFIPEEGFLGVQAQLTSESYILAEKCHLTGGFAFFSWFKDSADGNIKGGDFVLTLGGYHPQFKIPTHYPVVPRLGINWQVTNELLIKGGAYFALTPHVLMAGGRLEALWQKDNLRAWFIANADFLMNWQPFHYDAIFYVNIGAAYTFNFFGRHTITVDVGADLHIWGPEFSGTATIDVQIFKISIQFGDRSSTPSKLEPITWVAFKKSFLPADDQVCGINVQGGLVRQIQENHKDRNGNHVDETRWIINPKDFVLVTNSVIPSNEACLPEDTEYDPSSIQSFGIRPMGVSSTGHTSTHTVEVHRNGIPFTHLEFIPIKKTVPAALWGEPQMDGNGNLKLPEINPDKAFVEDTLAGFEIRPRAIKNVPSGERVDVKISYEISERKDAFQWEPILTEDVEQGKEAWISARETMLGEDVRKARLSLINRLGFPESSLNFSEQVTQDIMASLDQVPV